MQQSTPFQHPLLGTLYRVPSTGYPHKVTTKRPLIRQAECAEWSSSLELPCPKLKANIAGQQQIRHFFLPRPLPTRIYGCNLGNALPHPALFALLHFSQLGLQNCSFAGLHLWPNVGQAALLHFPLGHDMLIELTATPPSTSLRPVS